MADRCQAQTWTSSLVGRSGSIAGMASAQMRSPFPPPNMQGNSLANSASPSQQSPRSRMPKLQFSPECAVGEKSAKPWGTMSARLPENDPISARLDGAKTDRGHYHPPNSEVRASPRKSQFRARTSLISRLSLPSDWKKDAARMRTAPLPGLGVADFHLSDFQSYTRSPAQKLGQLDNWPSTNSQGSKSWLSRLETFIDNRMEMVPEGDLEQEVLAYHECFAKFIEDFKNYKPILSRVYHAYQKFIEFAQVSLRRVSELEFEMFTMQEGMQEEVRRSHMDAANKLRDLENALIAAKDSEKRAIANLNEVAKELAVAKDEVGKEKEQRDKLEEINKAYCSGYKWVIKHVAKADEPSDLDAMETVNLIQKLERALADANNSRFQMEYLQRTSEVVAAKTTLEEERRLFGEETERMQTELDNLRHSENAVSRQYRQAKTSCEALQEQVNQMQTQLENVFLIHLGDGEDLPALLRTKRPIVNRQTSKDEALELTALVFKEAVERWNGGSYPDIEEVVVKVLSEYYHQHNIAEWTRNLLDALQEHREAPDLALVGGVMAEALGPHALLRRCTFFQELGDRLTALAFRMHTALNTANSNVNSAASVASRAPSQAPSQTAASPDPKPSETTPNPPPSTTASNSFDEVAVEDILSEMQWVFGLKSTEQQEALVAFLSKDAVRGQRVSVRRIRSQSPLGFEEEFVELLQAQMVEDVRIYAADLRAAMAATAGKRKSRQTVPQISVAELREVLMALEPEKADEDIAMVIWRGFALNNYEEAYSIVAPDDDNNEDAGWGRTPSDSAEIPLEPIDRVLYRLSVANLLHKTEPQALPLPPRPATATGDSEAPSAPPGVEDKREEVGGGEPSAAAVEQAVVLDVEQRRFKAMREGLETHASKPVPRWARKADPGGSKPFLTTMVQAHRAKTKA